MTQYLKQKETSVVIDDQAYLEEKNRRITLRLKAKEKPWNSVLSLFIVYI